jgi:hypothetical protein
MRAAPTTRAGASNLRRVPFVRTSRPMALSALQGFQQRIAECNDAQPHLASLTPFSIEGHVVGHVKPA